MNRFLSFLLGAALTVLPFVSAQAQSAVDSARSIAIQQQTAQIKLNEDSLFKEACRNGTVTASGGCSGSAGNPRVTNIRRYTSKIRTARLRVDSIVQAMLVPITPPAPTNQAPVARYTITYIGNEARLDGSSSTDDKAVVSYTWTAAGKPTRTGPLNTRDCVVGVTPQFTETLTVTDSAGLTGIVSHLILCPSVPPPIDTTTPPPVDTTTPPTGIAAPELPRVVPPSADPYPGRACSVTVAPGGNVTGALAAARGGSVVCLTAGATYPVTQLPCRAAGDTGWVVLRTATTIPAGRMRPSLSGALAKIVTSLNNTPALTTCPGAFGYFVEGIEITTASTVTLMGDLVMLGTSGPLQDTMAEVPQRLIFSQVYVHGSPTLPLKRCILLNSGATAIVDSWISECHLAGQEGHGIGGWNGPGPHLIRNNYVDGAGINLMWGGATPSIPGMVAADITIQRNHVQKPIAWKGVWTVKNLLETKNAVRVLVEANVFDGSWEGAQIGPAILFKSANDQGDCHWCRTTDVTYRRSYAKNAAQGIVFSGAENYKGGRVDSVARRFLIEESVFDSIGIPPYAHSSGGARRIQIGTKASDIVFDRVVIHGKTDDGSAFVLDPNNASPRTAFRNSVFQHGYYFVTGTTMALGLPSYQWSGMTVVRGANLDPLPAGTTVVTAETAQAAAIRATVAAAIQGVVLPP